MGVSALADAPSHMLVVLFMDGVGRPVKGLIPQAEGEKTRWSKAVAPPSCLRTR